MNGLGLDESELVKYENLHPTPCYLSCEEMRLWVITVQTWITCLISAAGY